MKPHQKDFKLLHLLLPPLDTTQREDLKSCQIRWTQVRSLLLLSKDTWAQRLSLELSKLSQLLEQDLLLVVHPCKDPPQEHPGLPLVPLLNTELLKQALNMDLLPLLHHMDPTPNRDPALLLLQAKDLKAQLNTLNKEVTPNKDHNNQALNLNHKDSNRTVKLLQEPKLAKILQPANMASPLTLLTNQSTLLEKDTSLPQEPLLKLSILWDKTLLDSLSTLMTSSKMHRTSLKPSSRLVTNSTGIKVFRTALGNTSMALALVMLTRLLMERISSPPSFLNTSRPLERSMELSTKEK
jgi:hypothetical protein